MMKEVVSGKDVVSIRAIGDARVGFTRYRLTILEIPWSLSGKDAEKRFG